MRIISGMAAAGLAAILAIPASAQGRLVERDVEFYAEMLAMGEVCDEISFGVQRDALNDWVAERLTGGTEDDLEAVLDRRDAKVDSLRSEADRLRVMNRGHRRQSLTDDYFGQISTRCRRMAENDISKPFFALRHGPATSS